ncbi:MAG: FAD-binding oxidoreductase [Candidatus Lokiarchaeota archaeon]|nr:FAD-binding oxidoreductase [Candidatus Lokiarchaeota archaeon]
MNNSEIISELKIVVGEKYVSDRPEIRYLYHYDFITTEPEGKCDIVIIPGSVEEVQAIVKIANKYKIPLVPWVSGMDFGSIATPRRGGIDIIAKVEGEDFPTISKVILSKIHNIDGVERTSTHLVAPL